MVSRKCAKWITTHVQALAEQALISDTPFHVASLDLVKACNFLHREVWALCNDKFGMPPEVWASYDAFLGSIKRHFRILGAISEGVMSTTGCPEGDAMAVYQMTQINWLATLHIEMHQSRTHDTVFLNYMDSWLFHSCYYNALEASVHAVCGLADIAGYRISKARHGYQVLPLWRARFLNPGFSMAVSQLSAPPKWNWGPFCDSQKLQLLLEFSRAGRTGFGESILW